MKKTLMSAIAAAILSIIPQLSSAQFSDAYSAGLITTRPELGVAEMLSLSQYSHSFGTARSTALGGAFTSLGADLSSMSINPAGLAMYRSSEFGFTQAMSFSKTTTSGGAYGSANKNRYALNNASLALHLYEGSGPLTSFTMGVGYNKIADFNYRIKASSGGQQYTLADIFITQLNGINRRVVESNGVWDDSSIGLNRWGAVLGYDTFLINYLQEDESRYVSDRIAENATITPTVTVNSRGRIGEYSIAGAFNFSNVLYVGFAFGIHDIYIRQDTHYGEAYTNNSAAPEPIDNMYFSQYKRISGSAVNFKFGATVHPVPGLRIGVAVHTPSWVTMDEDYGGDMTLYRNGNAASETEWVEGRFSDDIKTPTRFLTGISYTFGNIGLITFDYERTWYNGIRLKSDVGYSTEAWYTSTIKDNFQASNTFRVGAELVPHPLVSVRAGFADYGSMLANSNRKYTFTSDTQRRMRYETNFNEPIAYHTYNISAGLGFRLNYGITLDLTYVFTHTDYTDFDLFDNVQYATTLGERIKVGDIGTERKRHNFLVSLGFRF